MGVTLRTPRFLGFDSGSLAQVNCFDDFIAASEYLVRNKYVAADKLTIAGGSNGGTNIGFVLAILLS